MSLHPSQWLDSVDSLSGLHLWFRAVRRNTQSMRLHLQLHLRLIADYLSRPPLPFLGQVLSLVKPTLLPVPACGHSPQEYHLPRKVSSHFPLLACLVASVPGATRLQLCEPVATTALPCVRPARSSPSLAPFPVFTCAMMVLGAGSCCFTVPRSAWSLRCSSACFCEASLAASRALRPTCCVVIAKFGVPARDC